MGSRVPELLSHEDVHTFILVMRARAQRDAAHMTFCVTAPMETNQEL